MTTIHFSPPTSLEQLYGQELNAISTRLSEGSHPYKALNAEAPRIIELADCYKKELSSKSLNTDSIDFLNLKIEQLIQKLKSLYFQCSFFEVPYAKQELHMKALRKLQQFKYSPSAINQLLHSSQRIEYFADDISFISNRTAIARIDRTIVTKNITNLVKNAVITIKESLPCFVDFYRFFKKEVELQELIRNSRLIFVKKTSNDTSLEKQVLGFSLTEKESISSETILYQQELQKEFSKWQENVLTSHSHNRSHFQQALTRCITKIARKHQSAHQNTNPLDQIHTSLALIYYSLGRLFLEKQTLLETNPLEKQLDVSYFDFSQSSKLDHKISLIQNKIYVKNFVHLKSLKQLCRVSNYPELDKYNKMVRRKFAHSFTALSFKQKFSFLLDGRFETIIHNLHNTCLKIGITEANEKLSTLQTNFAIEKKKLDLLLRKKISYNFTEDFERARQETDITTLVHKLQKTSLHPQKKKKQRNEIASSSQNNVFSPPSQEKDEVHTTSVTSQDIKATNSQNISSESFLQVFAEEPTHLFTEGYHDRVLRWFANPSKVIESDQKYALLPKEQVLEMIFRHNFDKIIDKYVVYYFTKFTCWIHGERREIWTAPATLVFNKTIYECIVEYSFPLIYDSEGNAKRGSCIHRYIANITDSQLHNQAKNRHTSEEEVFLPDELHGEWQTSKSHIKLVEDNTSLRLFDQARGAILTIKKPSYLCV